MYKINPSKYSGIFVMPVEISDKYIKMLSSGLLKAIIFLCRNADKLTDKKALAEGTGMSEEEAEEALEYWCGEGYIIDCKAPENTEKEESENITAETNSDNGKTEEKKVLFKNKPGRISYQQICARIEESEMVRALFSEAQLKLGRTIGTADQSALLNLHDYYGLPVEVILAICQYASDHGKSSNINYIFSVGSDWSMREIDSIEAADEELRKLEQVSSIWVDFRKITGIKTQHPTSSQAKYLNIWTGEWNFSINMINCAYEEMSKHTESVSFPYINKILAQWHSEGIKTPEEAEERQKKFIEEKERKAAQKTKTSSHYGVRTKTEDSSEPASYDIEKATEFMNTTVPVYKKKEKR